MDCHVTVPNKLNQMRHKKSLPVKFNGQGLLTPTNVKGKSTSQNHNYSSSSIFIDNKESYKQISFVERI